MTCKDIQKQYLLDEKKLKDKSPRIKADAHDKESQLPCVEIVECEENINYSFDNYDYAKNKLNYDSRYSKSGLSFDTLATGQGKGPSLSIVNACWKKDFGIVFNLHLWNQSIFISDPSYEECNSEIFNLNIAEIFVAPYFENETVNGPQCYNEIDVNPSNAIYQSGIYNNNGTLSHSLYNCNTSGILHTAISRPKVQTWSGSVQIPWDILNNPRACPVVREKDNNNQNIYRINFYRISETELLEKQEDPYKCNSEVCNYYAWSPTLKNPPNFHVPSQFGYLILK